MAFNLVTAVQERMGFGSFDKIDPNNQQGKKELTQSLSSDQYAQAATTAILLGLYKYGETKQGAEQLLHGSTNNILSNIFEGDEQKVIEKVSAYGNKHLDDSRLFLENIAQAAANIIRKEIGDNATVDTLYNFLAAQRHNILVYLPPDMQIGEKVNDESLEDRTNKMEGPVSNLMHKIEDLFSARENKE